MSRIRIEIPGELAYRDMTVRMVSAAARLVDGGDDDFIAEVISAFGEAFNNIAIHGYRDHPGSIDIAIDFGANWITIGLSDRGHAFDVTTSPAPDLDALPESGMGIYILRSFMDEVTYAPGDPNVLTMTKRCRS